MKHQQFHLKTIKIIFSSATISGILPIFTLKSKQNVCIFNFEILFLCPNKFSDFSVNLFIIPDYINMIFQLMKSLPDTGSKARNLVG